GLGGDGHLDLLAHAHAAVALPRLLRDEDAQVVAQPGLFLPGEQVVVGDVRFEVLPPGVGERLGEGVFPAAAVGAGGQHGSPRTRRSGDYLHSMRTAAPAGLRIRPSPKRKRGTRLVPRLRFGLGWPPLACRAGRPYDGRVAPGDAEEKSRHVARTPSDP